MKQEKMWIADNQDGTYSNPILYTDYSDPDVIRVGTDFFMTASSFCNTPALPVLHSKDLVNWKVISYGLEKIPFSDYNVPQHGRGVWAPSIRWHDNKFWIFYPMPDEGIFCVTSTNPWNGWSEPICVRKVVGWIDPCPFWDDDGSAYMVTAFARSRIGFKSILHLSTIKPDATGVLDDGKHIFDGNMTQPTIEGPKMYKRNGYYYIFAPAGGVKTGWQTVLRSKNIWGPYEEKIVMQQGSSPINGPHQGGWVDTPEGENWFIHFQDVGNAGRIIHLQPMYWENDWPVIGVEKERKGCGEPVLKYKKPNMMLSETITADAPEDSDDFNGEKLGLQWQWNANYQKEWYELADKKLILYAQKKEVSTKLCDVSNLLLQKWPAPEFKIATKIDISSLKNENMAGIISLGGVYSALAVKIEENRKYLVQITGEWEKDEREERLLEISSKQNQISLFMTIRQQETVSFSYSILEEEEITVGKPVTMTPGRWVGVKTGLFCVCLEEEQAGNTKVEYFLYTKLSDKGFF